ncbi:50S ribosomal protein L11 methyltransferase [Anaeromyxobacter oryzisoli]|uniref:50S ribosomal protein L11 methyltransferase n=1 Tax=Anaeromyxobacter oryzisoli TaxID=2925408 RepID=UPI001F5AB475|nr:50S ribosomal protein L11 methyltransferase [Anaeromyxobacter sp. SG63]
MPTYSVTVETDQPRAEDLSVELWDRGASGVEVRDGEGIPMPGLPRPPPGRAILVAWFDDREDAAGAAAALGGEIAEVPEEDWSETWKEGLGPMIIGRVFVRPSWVDAPVPAGLAEVVLDPGMAFGTGTHPTTSLCLAALSERLAARPGAAVLDVGTGSGLLAIAARKLGAGRVAGNDNDPVAVGVARENAARNGAAVELTVEPLSAIRGPFDVVVANILANTLVELAPGIAAQLAPGGVVLLSGILGPQEDEVRAAYVAQGLEPLPGSDRRAGEWSLLALERPRG